METHAIQSEPNPKRPERRRDDRFTAEDAMTALGAMIDISASGLSVLAEKQPPLTPGDRFRIEVRYDDRILLFPTELVYADRNAALLLVDEDQQGVKLGLKFGKLTPAQMREVQTIMDRGVKVPHLEIAWDMASIQNQTETSEAAEIDMDTTAETTASVAATESSDAVTKPNDALDELEDLRDQADALAELTESSQPSVAKPHQDEADEEESEQSNWVRTLHQPQPQARPVQPGEVNQRHSGRILAEDATCSLGQIVDMSSGGVCVQRKGAAPVRVGSQFMLDLQIAGRVLRAPVEVMRIQKIGWRSFEYGLKFGDWPDDIRAEFGRLVRMTAKATNVR
ncbi:MAG: PilZ domain-containing protein [Planctomycetota bacterium]